MNPECITNFLGIPLRTPQRSGTQANAQRRDGEQGDSRPYYSFERSVCTRQINEIKECIDDTRERIRTLKSTIHTLQKNSKISTESNMSLTEIHSMVTEFDQELKKTNNDLNELLKEEMNRNITTDMQQSASKVYLNTVRNRVALLAAMVLVELHQLPINQRIDYHTLRNRNKTVISKLKEMQIGVFSAYRQLYATNQKTPPQQRCMNMYRQLLQQLRASATNVQKALTAFFDDLSGPSFVRYDIAVNTALKDGVAIMQEYEKLSKECF
jgi:hypothetical protein